EKDYQQLQLIRHLVRDLDIPVEIEPVPTVREPDGLALSSRNRYLSVEERARAAALPQALRDLIAAVQSRPDGPFDDLVSAARDRLLGAGFTGVDYVAICDAATLAPVSALTGPARALVAARLGRTRLIDNMLVSKAESAGDTPHSGGNGLVGNAGAVGPMKG